MFDGGRRRQRAALGEMPRGTHSRRTAALHSGQTGPAPAELELQDVPAPAAALPAPSFWDSTWARALMPAGVFGALALVFQADLAVAAVTAGALMGSILLHETAHILGLRVWGDTTPARHGRDSLNPLSHADMLGSAVLPTASLAVSKAVTGVPLMVGWAKPVPVEFNNLRSVRRDAAKVALLGPAANLALAALAGGALLALPSLGLISTTGTAAFALSTLFKVNLALTAFNLLPLPWTDGGKLVISVLPKKLYSWWTHNPRIPEPYQALYQKLYEGPSRALSFFNLETRGQINTVTAGLSLAALGVFLYGLTFTPLHLPLLFLALPCSYDYWCIREKVRSEKAVSEMMDLMSEWGALLAALADDLDAESEVSAFEAEHAMKNAVDQLLEDLMAKKSFRDLSDEEKVKEFMRVYPDAAVRLLKEKVFTEDSEDKIREILADKRNTRFFERLESWLGEHKVFEKMASPHEKKHLNDAMEEAENQRTQGGGR